MKKIKKIFLNNIKLFIGLLVGFVLAGGTVYAATILFNGNEVTYNNSNSGMSSTNVQDAIDELYSAAISGGGCPSSRFEPGDYIDMTPTSNSFTPDRELTGLVEYDEFKGNEAGTTAVSGTLNPSYLNVWRVIRINEDCTVEVVSEYVSDVTVKFAGKVGYKNYVYYLNEIAKQYANTAFTLDPSTAPDGAFRNVGYDGQTKQITSETRLTDTTLGANGGAWRNKAPDMPGVEENLGGGDFKFATDLKLMSDAGVSAVAYSKGSTVGTLKKDYWLASRLYRWGGGDDIWNFNARYMGNNGEVYFNYLYRWYSPTFREDTTYYAIRPIVTLKSGLTPTGGDGSSSSHYTLN